MTDLELARVCAEAMELRVFVDAYGTLCIEQLDILSADNVAYDPLHDDAQAMALVRRFHIDLNWSDMSVWDASWFHDDYMGDWENDELQAHAAHSDLNRAICECVAKMTRRA